MKIDRERFIQLVDKRLFVDQLNPSQRAGIEAILDDWELRKLTDMRKLAYMLATAKWETNATMQPVREAYWLSEDWRRRNLRYYPYYGRGLPQLTWEYNYAKMTKILRPRFINQFPGFDLVETPDLALEPVVAIAIMFEGMLDADSTVGDFTGLSLEYFFNDTTDSPVAARRIINGTDHDTEIAEIHNAFLACLLDEELPPRILQYGMKGADVAALQKALGRYYVGVIDDDFGPATRRAVRDFQLANGLDVDGVVGKATRTALKG